MAAMTIQNYLGSAVRIPVFCRMVGSGASTLPKQKPAGLLTGILIAVLSMVLFSSTHSAVRMLSDTMSAFEIVFWRMAVSLLLILPYFAWKGFHRLKTVRPGLHAQRAAVNFAGMVLWFHALGIVPLGKAVAIHFTLPLFVLVLAALVLQEKVGPRRIAATAVGFSGMLVILRPGIDAIGLPEAMILMSALLYAATVIYLKNMVRTESPLAITFYTNAFICLLCVPPTIYFWVPPTVDDILPIAIIGVLGMLAPLLFTMALRSADASVIAPMDFLRLPFTAAIAFALFGEVPEIWVWIGGGIIFFSTWYITMRESRLERARRAREAASEADLPGAGRP
ncbi:MAG: DMT family transporter [Rhodospirillaceae bacterium]